MRFIPRRCPRSDCSCLVSGHFRWRHRGTYRRRCDGRDIQRFLCLECYRSFSTQSFRLDYRLKQPGLHLQLLPHFVSKVTHRQSARLLRCSRRTLAHRLRLLGAHCRAFQLERLGRVKLRGTFQLDELETFEHSRKLAPLTVPVLLERHSYFVLDARVAPLPARGRLSKAHRIRKREREALLGKRRSGSVAAVSACFDLLGRCHDEGTVIVQTDRKQSYGSILVRRFGVRLVHQRFSSTSPRNYANPLFPVNHTNAMLRDGLSRLVRRSWAASKKAIALQSHLWIWIAWRNFVRWITNHRPGITAAMALGVADRPLRISDLCRWRILA